MNPRSFPVPSIARALGALTVLASMALSQGTQVPCSTGQQPMCYREFAACSLSSTTETDVYQFFGVAGERIRVSVSTTTANLDPIVEVRTPSNAVFTPPMPINCSANSVSTCTVEREFNLPVGESGLYSLLLSDAGNDNAGSYYLVLERLLPVGVVAELEYGVTKTVNIGFPGEVEWLKFEAAQGTSTRLSFQGQTANLDPRVRIYDPSGVVVQPTIGCDANSVSTCSFQVNFNSMPSSGVYTAMIYDGGIDNTGNVGVTLSCLTGVCPPNVNLTPPVPGASTFCMTNANTTTSVATIAAFGSNAIADNDIFLRVSGAPANKFAIFFAGLTPNPTPANLPFSEGALCLLPPLTRLPLQFTCSAGTITRQLDLTSPALAPLVAPGQSTYFQAWFRDPTASGSTFDTNTSDGLEVPFQ